MKSKYRLAWGEGWKGKHHNGVYVWALEFLFLRASPHSLSFRRGTRTPISCTTTTTKSTNGGLLSHVWLPALPLPLPSRPSLVPRVLVGWWVRREPHHRRVSWELRRATVAQASRTRVAGNLLLLLWLLCISAIRSRGAGSPRGDSHVL